MFLLLDSIPEGDIYDIVLAILHSMLYMLCVEP